MYFTPYSSSYSSVSTCLKVSLFLSTAPYFFIPSPRVTCNFHLLCFCCAHPDSFLIYCCWEKERGDENEVDGRRHAQIDPMYISTHYWEFHLKRWNPLTNPSTIIMPTIPPPWWWGDDAGTLFFWSLNKSGRNRIIIFLRKWVTRRVVEFIKVFCVSFTRRYLFFLGWWSEWVSKFFVAMNKGGKRDELKFTHLFYFPKFLEILGR